METWERDQMIPSVRKGARILIMDDEESILEVTSEILRVFGYEVEGSRDGEEALRKYRQAMLDGKRFDLVIMDLTIPMGMGGQDAVRELLAIDPQARALVSSGHMADPVISNYRAHGFVGAIPKPYRMDELDVIVKKALASTPS
jgi:CheY-like chemotaxis protein